MHDFLDTSYFGLLGAIAVASDDEKLDMENIVWGRAGNLPNIERAERIVATGLGGVAKLVVVMVMVAVVVVVTVMVRKSSESSCALGGDIGAAAKASASERRD